MDQELKTARPAETSGGTSGGTGPVEGPEARAVRETEAGGALAGVLPADLAGFVEAVRRTQCALPKPERGRTPDPVVSTASAVPDSIYETAGNVIDFGDNPNIAPAGSTSPYRNKKEG